MAANLTPIAIDNRSALRAISADVCEDVFQPPPELTVSEWADANRMLPRTSAEPGRWRTDRVPYLRGVMDALGDESIRVVLFIKSAQVGGTSCGENFIAFLIDLAPCGILMLWPTEKKMRSWSRKQLTPLLEDTEVLAAKIPKSNRRDAGNTIAAKEFPGGFLQMLTAKSTSDLRSTSARVGIIEEFDEIDAEVGDQGDPIEQFDARFRTFWNSKQYHVSTPTVEGISRSWAEWLTSTQHRFYVPCPHCGHKQILKWRDGQEETDQGSAGDYRLLWERDENGEVIPGTTKYCCQGCGLLIDEHHKMAMLRAGEWRATYPGRYIVGFHINTLYSPLCSWDDVARAFTKAQRSPAKMQTFVNLWLGLPYREPGTQIDAHFLEQRAEDFGENEELRIPHGVGVLTAGVDVQGDRLEVTIWGWGAHEESWVLAWEQLHGDPGQDDVWRDLDRFLQETLTHQSGAPVKIEAVCIDANYQSDRVHRFCIPRVHRNIIPVIGRDGPGRKLIEPPRPDRYKRSARERNPSYVVGTDTAKALLYSRLRLTKDGEGKPPREYVHFNSSLDSVFYDQLTSERLVTVYKGGRPTRAWKLMADRRNEVLDQANYAAAALKFLTIGRVPKLKLSELAERAKKLSEWEAPKEKKQSAPAPQLPPRGGFVSGWKRR